jgi:hypothetical protein
MPRRPTEHNGSVPLWLIPQIILQNIQKFGEDLEWIRVRRSIHHFYVISIRMRSIKREFSHRAAALAEGL